MEKHIPPLAYRIRPECLDELIGQDEARNFLQSFITGNRRSAILWGPPGSGKSSLAHIIEKLYPDSYFLISAVTSGVADIKRVVKLAEGLPVPPIAFIDEIHRFTRVQQDALLPFVESGEIVLIGATTENPSFSLTAPLLSRCQVILFHPLDPDHIEGIIRRALGMDETVKGLNKTLSDKALKALSAAADGDARAALNLLELVLTKSPKDRIEAEDLGSLLERPLYHDKTGERHYDLISAFHKSVRASDIHASIYWLGRMLEGGEDRLFVLRRMIRIASEDIGLAEPNALRMVISARDAFTALGSPEGELAIYEAAVYLACAPKSNALYIAEKKVRELIRKTGTPPVPLYLRNAPTKLMKDLGYGKGYIYAHDDPEGALLVSYFPEGMEEVRLYVPRDTGFERRIKEIMNARKKAAAHRAGTYRKTS
ncbi:MAG TPA: replication-associated recombination protein A [Deltaproteobacteria bacterium]|jgi:putative ATPase|nr:replication-associated recombination protein A [Deltaproteobacteria bacterium]HOI07969.1 replication-associated recombination protein A [Deltaproteobacteria bacterium]